MSKDVYRTVSKTKHTNVAGPYSMTEELLQERAKRINAGRFITQAYAGIVASVSSISFGTVLGWSSPAIRIAIDKVYRGQETLNPAFDLSWVASLGPLGCALGVLVWSYFNIKLGPKKTMLIQSPLLLITWALIANAENDIKGKDINLELVLRFFCGFFAISNRICGETLLQDAVHKYYLTRMVIPYRSCVNLGVLLTYSLAYSISEQYFAIVNCVIVAIHCILLVISPESPVYLYDKNLKKAEASLSWYRGKSNIYVEMRNIKKDSDIRKLDQAAYKYMLFSKVVVKAMVIIIMVNCAQVFSCYYMFLYYNPAVVKAKVRGQSVGGKIEDFRIAKHADGISRNVDAYILSINMFIGCVISSWVHFRMQFGIKKPLILSCALVTVILAFICAYFMFLHFRFAFLFQRNVWIYQVLVNLLVICFEIGLSTAPDMMLIDYVPNQVFPLAKLIIKFSQWLIIFFLIKCFFNVASLVSLTGAFALFTILCFCLCITCRFFVIESKGKTLVQVQTEIGGNPIGTRGIYNKKVTIGGESDSEEINEALLM